MSGIKKLILALTVLYLTPSLFALSPMYVLEDKVRWQMRMAADVTAVTQEQLRDFIQEAIIEVDEKLRPKHAFDTLWTEQETSMYALNMDCYDNGVVGVRCLSDSANAKYEAVRSILQRDQGMIVESDGTGPPPWYWTFGGYIFFDHTPQDSYRVEIEYEAKCDTMSTELSDSSAYTCIGDEHDDLVIDYTRYVILKRFRLDMEADMLLNRWKTNVAEARALIRRIPDPLVNPQSERGRQ